MKELPLFRSVCSLVVLLIMFLFLSAMAATATTLTETEIKTLQVTSTSVLPVTSHIDANPATVSSETTAAVAQISEKSKVVYLTFDDGPEPVNTPRILDILKHYKVPATFFVVGTQIEAYPEILQRIKAEGHAIGNHSYNHRYKELYQSPEAYIAQLRKTDMLIENVVGAKSLVSRAPGGTAGSFTADYWAALKRDDYWEVGWNICSGDASTAHSQQIAANVIQQAKQQHLWPRAIVLMHDGTGHLETVAALPRIIEYFQQEGFEFRVVDRSTPAPW